MEFRSCPSCKASVLEDDVEDCPFCGASMSGKPGAKPAPKPAAKPPQAGSAKAAAPAAAKAAGAAKTPAAGAPSRTRPEPEPEKPADDADPFEVDPLAHKQAALVSVKVGKGRTIEVKCPMCETVGFIAPSQAGKDVKCCNPSCKLPIFKSPKLPAVVEAAPEKPKGLSGIMLGLIGLVVAGLTGGGIYFFILKEEPKPPAPVNPTDVTPVDTTPVVKTPENVVVHPEKHVVSTVAEIGKLSLQEILKVAVQHDLRSRPYGRQLAAEACLTVGDLAGAKEQLAKIGANGETYAVEPLAILAQLQLEAGDKPAAEASLKEAITRSTKLQDVLRSHHDTVAVLAATLVRLDRPKEAVDLLRRFSQKENNSAAILSVFWRSSLDRGTFDFVKESSLSHLELGGKPLWVSTTVHLCRRDQWDQALAWARSAPDQVTQDASLAACAGMMAAKQLRSPDPALEARLKAAVDAAGLAAKVRMLVAAAEVRFQAGDKGVTAATVTEIDTLLAASQIPPAAVMPGIKAIYDSKGIPFAGLPDPAPGTSLALAFADLANLQIKLGDTAGGWATVGKAMEMLRSVTPSPAMAQHLVDQCDNNRSVVENQLNAELKLGNDGAKKFRAHSQYRVQATLILKLANERFGIQQTLLRRLIRQGLLKEVWQYAQDLEQAEMALAEPYRSRTTLLTELIYLSQAQGNTKFAEEAWGGYSDAEKKIAKQAEPTTGKLADSFKLARKGQVKEASELLKPLYVGTKVDRHVIDEHVLGLVSELGAKSITTAYSYIRRLGLADPTIKEDSLRLLAGMSITLDKGPELWKLIEEDVEITSNERAAAYLGFLEGIQVTGKK